MRRASPVTLIAAGLASLSCALILMGDFFFGYLPDREAETAQVRQRVVNNIALPAATLLSAGQLERLQSILDDYLGINADLESIGIRRKDGRLLISTRGHARRWLAGEIDGGDPTFVTVPLNTGSGSWGRVELRFADPPTGILAAINRNPGFVLLAMVICLGTLTYWLYMRRVLQEFDPAAVIPDRVRVAFDAMTEGVVVLDRKGRIALANNRFRQLSPTPDENLTAKPLSSVGWLAQVLPKATEQHPWNVSMLERRSSTGTIVEPTVGESEEASKLVVNCAPITDGRDRVRGCMVTFDDVSALHAANERLENALVDLQKSREEVEKKNADLERLANYDFLTGCLNRRAFTRQADEAYSVAHERRRPIATMMIDIDHFKSINDRFGHAVGDRVIKAVAGVLMGTVGEAGFVGRYGGEEFCIAMPDAGVTAATALGHRVREAIENEVIRQVDDVPGLKVTVSVGVSSFDKSLTSLEAMLQAADEALYEAKQTGRNRVCVAAVGSAEAAASA